MEILYIILAFILGAVLAYFILKSSSVSRKSYEELQQNFNQKEADFNKIIAEISAENKAQLQKIAEQQELNERQNSEIKDLQSDKNQLIGLKSQLAAQNESLQQLLDSQKEEIVKIQEEAKLQFENLANKILEEKTLKFTEQNQQNLKNILNPLQEKITDFEKKSRKYTQRKYRLSRSSSSTNSWFKRNEFANEQRNAKSYQSIERR